MISYETNDTRIYLFMYMVSKDISHIETAYSRNYRMTYILCMEHRLMTEYKDVEQRFTSSKTQYKPLKIVA